MEKTVMSETNALNLLNQIRQGDPHQVLEDFARAYIASQPLENINLEWLVDNIELVAQPDWRTGAICYYFRKRENRR